MTELTTLTTRRGQLKAQLTRLATYIREENESEIDIDQVRIRAEKAREVWEDFQQIQARIEEEGEAKEDNEKYRGEFEELFYRNLARCEKLLRLSNSSSTSSAVSIPATNSERVNLNVPTSDNALPVVQSAVKLAALQIPVFDGAYTDWATFYDIFSALIHNNDSLSEIQKFFYLRSSLTGDAEKVIKCLQTTSNNYIVAWNSLVARYDNKKVLIQVHAQALFDLEPIKKESSSHLRKLIDELTGHLKALESLGETPEHWGALLLYLITSKLDLKTRQEWETVSAKMGVSGAMELIELVKSRFRILEAVESSNRINSFQDNNRKQTTIAKGMTTRTHALAMAGEIKCFLCKQSHTIYKCPSFLSLSITDRIKKANDLKLCKICLRKHEGERCRSRLCPICTRPHNGLLHLSRADKPKIQNGVENNVIDQQLVVQNSSDPSVSVNTHVYRKNSQILLSTASVVVYDYNKKPVICRVLLDSGSQHNFMTEAMAQQLRLKRTKTTCAVIGINEASHTATSIVTTTVKSRISNYSLNLDFFVLPKLTTKIPIMPVDRSTLNLPSNLTLADPSFGTPQVIDMLVGAEIFFEIINGDKLQPIAHGPVLQNTRFGWIVTGPIPHCVNREDEASVSLFTHSSTQEESLENKMAAFWRLEEVKTDEAYTLEERLCKQHFEKNVHRGSDGRFTVLLPFRDALKLGKSYDTALRRFLALERRFQVDKNLKIEYVKFIKEYIDLEHMSITRNVLIDNRCYYLPHHAVHKDSSTSTKLRVVFDASMKTDTSLSLNDVLLKGPCIQEELVSIMSRFRTHKYVITADIKKMYRQIWVADNQRDYQRILWRENPDQPINTYRLNTVTYGVITASYLATACLKRLADEEVSRFPEACRALSEDFYVDDFLGGAASISETLKLRNDLIAVLKTAGLELCKWSSNEASLLSGVDAITSSTNDISKNVEKITKILGVYWNQNNDAYQYNVQPYNENAQITKRIILSEVASIFDPLGLISPVIIKFKIIMQKLWKVKTDWDATLPSDIEREWRSCRKNLIYLNSIAINRSIIGNGEIADIQLHGFADASEDAYGACLYLRVTNYDGTHISNLICSKSRVSPLKTISIPRLELLAAVLLARLASKYASSLRLSISKGFFWSDSTVVLAWIASESSRWKTFVANRVGEIHERTSINQWGHVSTRDNPADIVSRGCSSSQIKDFELWWKGPTWLMADRENWPNKNMESIDIDNTLLEEKTVVHVTSTNHYDLHFLERYSSLLRLVRVIAYCRRFAHNTSSKINKIYGPIRADEFDKSTTCIVRLVQLNNFQREISDLKHSRPIHQKSALLRLNPFIDANGLLRVGGRLRNASTIGMYQRHPIVLPAKCYFTKLIFLHEHEILLHAGPQAMLASVRLRYWPMNGRNIARMVVYRCIKCFKYRPTVVQPIMGDLPTSRVEPDRAFKKTGVDFAGPFYVKNSLRRNAPKSKAYACIWVCFSTKAVHIELVGDLTTQSFLNALQRFCDRRGLCTDIFSDNATNFVGANRQLQELKLLFAAKEHQEQVQNTLTKNGIQWHFIPPRSPHFGGLWEAAVKSLKSHLYKTLGNASLTFEELNTLLVRIEAILNSRPLTPISTDPSDMSVLTPGHFLIGESLRALPDRDESSTPMNRLSRWKRVTQVAQHFWSRWSKEYIGQLQERAKWSNSRGSQLQPGTIVLIRDDQFPPLEWSIGRVVVIHAGADKQVRVATVKTSRGEFKRAVRNLCPLPFDGNRPNEIK